MITALATVEIPFSARAGPARPNFRLVALQRSGGRELAPAAEKMPRAMRLGSASARRA